MSSVITRILKSGYPFLALDKGDVTTEGKSERCSIADVKTEEGAMSQKCGWPLEAGKDREKLL